MDGWMVKPRSVDEKRLSIKWMTLRKGAGSSLLEALLDLRVAWSGLMDGWMGR